MTSLPKTLEAKGNEIRVPGCGLYLAEVHANFGTDAEAEALASEIARRWNAHESLVKAAQQADEALDEATGSSSIIGDGRMCEDTWQKAYDAMNALEAALALVKR